MVSGGSGGEHGVGTGRTEAEEVCWCQTGLQCHTLCPDHSLFLSLSPKNPSHFNFQMKNFKVCLCVRRQYA